VKDREASGVSEPRVSLADVAYTAIRRAILNCDLTPGEQVTEVRLAEQFGFGRAAVRVALTRLSHERLVQAMPRHGYTVAPITFKQVRDLFGVRLIVEPAAAGLAARANDPEVIAELDRLNDACIVRPGQDDPHWQRQANTAFHMAVARTSGNERLTEMVQTVLDELERVLYLPAITRDGVRVGASFAEHARIIEAIRRGDAESATQAATDHIVPNQRSVIDALIASPGLRSINLLGV
jgi:DNA-binding GntR family transcriptional regulator